MMEDYYWLNDYTILTRDKKLLNHFYKFDTVVDMNYLHWLNTGKPFENNVRNNAIDFLSNKFYNVKKLNEIIPLSKHNEYCSCLLYTSPSPRDGLLSRMPSSA